MRWLRGAFDATAGRRLLIRISLAGMVLFGGLLAIIFTTRAAMPGLDGHSALYTTPRFSAALADRALARWADPAALARELAAIEDDTGLGIAVFRADGTLVATTIAPAPPPASAAQLAELTRDDPLGSSDRRTIQHGLRRAALAGAFRDSALVAYAVVATPAVPSLTWHLVVLGGAALALAILLVGLPLAWSLVRPIRALDRAARRLGDGDLTVRAPADRRDEIGDLARSFNAMAGQIQRLRAAERELLGDVSHELRTPLARMRVVLDLAADADTDPERIRRYLREIASDLGELEQLLDDIITSARLDTSAEQRWDAAQPPLHRRAVDVREIVGSSAERFRARWPDRELVSEVPAEPALVLDGDPIVLRRALDNLLDNARKYSADDRPITVRIAPAHATVRVEVIDRGIGIASTDRDRVFTAFYRADRSRTRATGGVGLGLALARRIVELHGGRIDYASELERGSTFWLELPLAAHRAD